MRRAKEAFERHSGVEGHLEPDRIDGTAIGMENRRGHPGSIFDLIRIEGPTGAGRSFGRDR